ncbi:hypothetical protein CEXT_477811 [Caerostris extrusa]|uniref:BTB domain-containing protein n=1 Tax=Caerostris extrusa TaxID=172846 RepID=A0AAV4QXI8_CAEEX|nr:hypothetical protein CEXT_477811 [Caerostris extrusa]
MPDLNLSKRFRVLWKIKKFDLLCSKKRRSIKSPVFIIRALKNTKWNVIFYPRGLEDLDYMECSLVRISAAKEPETIKFKFKIGIITQDGNCRFQKSMNAFLKRNGYLYVTNFIKRSQLELSDTPNGILTIIFQFLPIPCLNSNLHKKDVEKLQKDLTSILTSGYRSDLTIHCLDQKFKVHKFVIRSRRPTFRRYFNIENIVQVNNVVVTDVEPSMLSSFLHRLYSN